MQQNNSNVYHVKDPRFKYNSYKLFSTRTKKILYFIRHGTSVHNEAVYYFTDMESITNISICLGRRNCVGRNRRYLDSPLSQKGIQEAKVLNIKIKYEPPFDLIIVSPLTRTLETMTYGFEGIKCPRLAHPLIREQCGDYYSDCYRDLDETIPKFKDVNFSLVKEKIDPYIQVRKRESTTHIDERGNELLDWLSKREETRIGIVSHSGFLKRFFGKYIIKDTSEKGILSVSFNNCDIKIVEISSS